MTRPGNVAGVEEADYQPPTTARPVLGDRVAFAVRYLETVCQHVTIAEGNRGWLVGDAPQMRGIVICYGESWRDLVTVQSDAGAVFGIHIGNLVRECDIDLDARQWSDFQAQRRQQVKPVPAERARIHHPASTDAGMGLLNFLQWCAEGPPWAKGDPERIDEVDDVGRLQAHIWLGMTMGRDALAKIDGRAGGSRNV